MLKGFKVISVYGNTSESTVTVTNKYFKFNADTAVELGYRLNLWGGAILLL